MEWSGALFLFVYMLEGPSAVYRGKNVEVMVKFQFLSLRRKKNKKNFVFHVCNWILNKYARVLNIIIFVVLFVLLGSGAIYSIHSKLLCVAYDAFFIPRKVSSASSWRVIFRLSFSSLVFVFFIIICIIF